MLGRYYTIISILCKKIELFPSAGQLKDQSYKHMFVRVFLEVCNFFIWYIKSVSVFYFDCPRIFHHKICSSRKKISVLITTVYWPRNNNFVKCEINDDFLLCLHRFIPFLFKTVELFYYIINACISGSIVIIYVIIINIIIIIIKLLFLIMKETPTKRVRWRTIYPGSPQARLTTC